MLSTETTKHLNNGCKVSSSIYEQGGLVYKYTFSHHWRTRLIDDEIIKKSENPRFFNEEEINKINYFFESALVGAWPKSISTSTLEFTHQFFSLIEIDFPGMYSCISEFEDDDTSMSLTLTFIENKNFHSLEFFWSLD